MVQLENHLLAVYFTLEFLFRRQVRNVLGRKHLVVLRKRGILGHVLVRIGAEDDADGGIVALALRVFVVHLQVPVHLSHVLIGNLVHLEVDKHKALDDVVVEHQVDVIVVVHRMDVLLACYKGIPLAHFHDELLQVADNGAFKVTLGIFRVRRKPQKLRHYRVLDKFQLVCLEGGRFFLHFGNYGSLVLRREQTEVVLGGNVTVKCPHAPCLFSRLTAIPVACLRVVHPQKDPIMGPGKQGRFSTHRVENLAVLGFSTQRVENFRERLEKIEEIVEIRLGIALAVLGSQAFGQGLYDFKPVIGPAFPAEFLFGDALAQEPVTDHKGRVHLTEGVILGHVNDSAGIRKNIRRFVVFQEFLFHLPILLDADFTLLKDSHLVQRHIGCQFVLQAIDFDELAVQFLLVFMELFEAGPPLGLHQLQPFLDAAEIGGVEGLLFTRQFVYFADGIHKLVFTIQIDDFIYRKIPGGFMSIPVGFSDSYAL